MAKDKNRDVVPVINPGGVDYGPLMTRPKKVAIVALGPSARVFMRRSLSEEGVKNPYDEVWTLNRGFRGFLHDKCFIMDDLRWLDEHRSKNYTKFLRTHEMPIVTSTCYPEFPTACPYPLKDVIDFHDDDIFAVNTVAYMIAYALFIGVKEMHLYGADFVYRNGVTVEEGGMAVAYMLGRCKMHGCTHVLSNETTMLYANQVVQREDGSIGREPYGWHRLAEMKTLQLEEDKQEAQRVKSKKLIKQRMTPSGDV